MKYELITGEPFQGKQVRSLMTHSPAAGTLLFWIRELIYYQLKSVCHSNLGVGSRRYFEND